MILTVSQMRGAEERAFASGTTSERLMEVAAEGVAATVRQFFPEPGTLAVYCGKGNNTGDALLAASLLHSAGWKVLIRLSSPVGEMNGMARRHLTLLPQENVVDALSGIRGPLVILDGLLGIGASGKPQGDVVRLIAELNAERLHRGAFTVAVDLPSGLEATTGEVFDPCVRADLTVTLGFAKTGLLADSATGHVGRLAVIPLPGVIAPEGDPAIAVGAPEWRHLLPIRDFDTHKGNYGRIGVVAGSPGYLGAARLCSAAAVHAGGGLVTLYAMPESHDLLAQTCVPEVMVRKVASYEEVLGERNDVLAIGPGLSRKHEGQLRALVAGATIPCVVDADALNAVSTDLSLLKTCAGKRLLTPHPGEMERLFPRGQRSRREWAVALSEEYPVTLLLKGSRTLVTQREFPPCFNTTGNPGMGSGGVGDVLTGVCAALIGGGRTAHEAAVLGAWICGRAAEIAVFNGDASQESISASSVVARLGAAFHSLRNGDY